MILGTDRSMSLSCPEYIQDLKILVVSKITKLGKKERFGQLSWWSDSELIVYYWKDEHPHQRFFKQTYMKIEHQVLEGGCVNKAFMMELRETQKKKTANTQRLKGTDWQVSK